MIWSIEEKYGNFCLTHDVQQGGMLLFERRSDAEDFLIMQGGRPAADSKTWIAPAGADKPRFVMRPMKVYAQSPWKRV